MTVDVTNENLVQSKTCTKCGEAKPVSGYYAKKSGRDGLHSWCKSCCASYKTEWWEKNKVEQTKRINLWRSDNQDLVAAYGKAWSDKNPDKVRARILRWRLENPKKFKEKERRAYEKRRSTAKGKLEDAMRSGVNRGITKGSKASRKTFDLLGYTIEELRKHIEANFLVGMSWENYGDWHIDHKIPLSVHNYETPDDIDFKRAWYLSNLRPMWATDNKKKSNKLTTAFQPSLAITMPANDNDHTTTKTTRKESA